MATMFTPRPVRILRRAGRRQPWSALSAAGLVVWLSGCGASSTVGSQSPTPRPAAVTPTATPSPTVDPLVAAGQAYLQAVALVNAAGDQVAAKEKGRHPFAFFVAPEKQWLAAIEAWQTALYHISWPPSVQSQATSLVASVQSEIAAVQDFVGNPNAATWAADSRAAQTSSAAAAAVRLVLHLPPITQSTP